LLESIYQYIAKGTIAIKNYGVSLGEIALNSSPIFTQALEGIDHGSDKD
jgi:hypothetical protein